MGGKEKKGNKHQEKAKIELRIKMLEAETRNYKQKGEYEFESAKFRALRDR